MHQALPSAPICPAQCVSLSARPGSTSASSAHRLLPTAALQIKFATPDPAPVSRVWKTATAMATRGGNLCFVHPTSPALNACVPCLEDEGGCPTGQVCKLDGNGGNSCVACLDSDNCPNGVCDTATNICVPCLADNTGCQDPHPDLQHPGSVTKMRGMH
jgi:hypothetical protein